MYTGGYSGRSGANAVRAVIATGYAPGGYNNVLSYVTIATLGNSTDFGDRQAGILGCATACASSTRAVFGGGWQPSPFNQLDYVEIMSTGNSTDFGDLTGNRSEAYGFSNGHGGLG